MEFIELTFEHPEQEAVRLDAWLAGRIPLHSRAFLKDLIEQGHVHVDGKTVKPSFKPKSGQTIRVELPDPVDSSVRPEEIPLVVRYEDDFILVIDKPQGMVVHPAPGHAGGTLVNALLSYCQGQLSDLNGVIRPGIVHRIDKDTSGLLLVVKDNSVHREIAERIRRHEIRRTYQALVHGAVSADQGTIKAPIGRDPKNRQRMAVVPDGKAAVTHFKVIERLARATWLEVELETGRTHQIRVHCQYIGHPIIGDLVYAPGRAAFGQTGQVLHASRLSFIHPVTNQPIVVESPLPQSFLEAVRQCR
ncbi:MAG: RluA family pseudouridine synthase [Clostridia bacterium]|nr:RluA family pseudouridine synthase [Clostridia bacterium]NCC74901.1 RluA family pseudouridine synthase [Clostridia bacterium]